MVIVLLHQHDTSAVETIDFIIIFAVKEYNPHLNTKQELVLLTKASPASTVW